LDMHNTHGVPHSASGSAVQRLIKKSASQWGQENPNSDDFMAYYEAAGVSDSGTWFDDLCRAMEISSLEICQRLYEMETQVCRLAAKEPDHEPDLPGAYQLLDAMNVIVNQVLSEAGQGQAGRPSKAGGTTSNAKPNTANTTPRRSQIPQIRVRQQEPTRTASPQEIGQPRQTPATTNRLETRDPNREKRPSPFAARQPPSRKPGLTNTNDTADAKQEGGLPPELQRAHQAYLATGDDNPDKKYAVLLSLRA